MSASVRHAIPFKVVPTGSESSGETPDAPPLSIEYLEPYVGGPWQVESQYGATRERIRAIRMKRERHWKWSLVLFRLLSACSGRGSDVRESAVYLKKDVASESFAERR